MTVTEQTRARSRSWRRSGLLALVGLVLAAVNLRLAVTSVGPVLAEIRAGTGMSATVAGLLTSLPVLCFAVFGFAAPRLARRFGSAVVVAAGLTLLAAGLAIRPYVPGTALFVLVSGLAMAGIAVVNVLMPVIVKQRFPDRVGSVTGVYSIALNVGASAAAAATVPITQAAGGDWRLGLAAWALVAALAVPAWVVLAGEKPAAEQPDAPEPVAASSGKRITREPVAWALAAYFGLQSTSAYVIMGWLPQIYRDAGIPASTAGVLFAVTSFLGVPLTFLLAWVVGRLRSQSGIALALGVAGIAGYAGLWYSPAAAPWLWALLLGVVNVAFPLVLTMIALRGRDPSTVVRLSAFAQSTGYLLSIPGPLLIGVLHDVTGGWRTPLAVMTALIVPQMIAGYVAGRDRQI